ncbi:hypothetical protein QYM36_008933, partial [Artemia franciscana]
SNVYGRRGSFYPSFNSSRCCPVVNFPPGNCLKLHTSCRLLQKTLIAKSVK